MRHCFTIEQWSHLRLTIAYLLPRCSCWLPRFARWALRPLIVIGTHRNQLGTVRELCGNPRRTDATGRKTGSVKRLNSLRSVGSGYCEWTAGLDPESSASAN